MQHIQKPTKRKTRSTFIESHHYTQTKPIINTADLNHFPFLPTNQRQELNNNTNNNSNSSNNDNINIVPIPLHQPIPYSQIVTQTQQSSNVAEQLSAFLNEFKTMFNQLISQNSMIINMLSPVINKIVN
jgi:hypothetical protein